MEAFSASALGQDWDLGAVGAAPTFELSDALVISDAATRDAVSMPGQSWIYDEAVDTGNQMHWNVFSGTADFDMSTGISWDSTDEQQTQFAVAGVDDESRMVFRVGFSDASGSGLGAPGPTSPTQPATKFDGTLPLQCSCSRKPEPLTLESLAWATSWLSPSMERRCLPRQWASSSPERATLTSRDVTNHRLGPFAAEQLGSYRCNKRVEGLGHRDSKPTTDDLDVAASPESIGAADDHFPALCEQPELEQRDRRLGIRREIDRDDVRHLESVEFPLNLAAELRVLDRLLPARVPVIASWVEDGHVENVELSLDTSLPVDGSSHADRASEKYARPVNVQRHRWF